MLKRRLIPCLFLQNGLIVRSQGFLEYSQLGNPTAQVERLTDWNADELVYVDITREGEHDLKRSDHKQVSRHDILEILKDVATRCFMPLTFGGGIRDLATVDRFIANGADKVVINTGAVRRPELLTEVAEKYGVQAMVLAVDVRREAGGWSLWIENGRTATGRTLDDWIPEAVRRGAGEIFVNSIDRDGSGTGFDLDLIRHVCALTDVPVIACGGAATFEHFLEALQHTPVSAVAAGNLFNFTENAYPRAKRFLHKAGLDVRLERKPGGNR